MRYSLIKISRCNRQWNNTWISFLIIRILFIPVFFIYPLIIGCHNRLEKFDSLHQNQPKREEENKTVSFQGINFSYTPLIAEEIIGEEVLANSDTSGFLYDDVPSHARFNFINSYVSRTPFNSFQYEWAPWLKLAIPPNYDTGPQVFVFPIADYIYINPIASERVEELAYILNQNSLPLINDYPVLPTFNSAQDFATQGILVDFQDGRGVRFITHYSQDTNPVINPHVFYSFQGLTSDNKFYVAAFFPLFISILPDQIEVDDWENFSLRYQVYLSNIASRIEKLDPIDIEPDLHSLDALIKSISIK